MKIFDIESIKKLGVFTYCLSMVFIALSNCDCPANYRALCGNDKLIHFTQYFVLILLVVLVFKININIWNGILLFTLISGISFAVEFIQFYIPGRDSTYLDSFYDILGALSGFLIAFWIRRCYKA